MAKWDVTTTEGREALERFLMERMGFQRKDGAWAHKDGGHVDESWLFSGDGMVWAKEWAALEHGWRVDSWTDEISSGARLTKPLEANGGYSRHLIIHDEAPDEPTAVALALAQALEEMER